MKKQKTKNTLFGLWGQLMVVELVPVGGRLGRRILAEKRPGEVFLGGGVLFCIQEPQCHELLMCLL